MSRPLWRLLAWFGQRKKQVESSWKKAELVIQILMLLQGISVAFVGLPFDGLRQHPWAHMGDIVQISDPEWRKIVPDEPFNV